MSEDIIFRQAPLSQPAQLVFGEPEQVADHQLSIVGALPALGGYVMLGTVRQMSIVGALPALGGTVHIGRYTDMSIVGALPALGGVVSLHYNSDTARPTVGKVAGEWQEGVAAPTGVVGTYTAMVPLKESGTPTWQQATKAGQGIEARQPHTYVRTRINREGRFECAVRAGNASTAAYANMLRAVRPTLGAAYQIAIPIRNSRFANWQDRLRRPRPALGVDWGEAEGRFGQRAGRFEKADRMQVRRNGRHQVAIRPPIGIHTYPPIPPTPNPCYTPPLGDAVHLLFRDPWATSGELLFACINDAPTTVLVPVRRTYIVLNNVTLRRVEGNIQLPALSLTLSIDNDSWTWGFSASLPASTLSLLEPGGPGDPVELEATINGTAYRLLAESIKRDRVFGKSTISLSGRGKSALLADPYSPVNSYSNTIDRTAQQLMDDALTFNGVALGWSLDWQIDDWVVPAGTWNHRGSYMSALTAIAGAAGAFIQPHPNSQILRVRPRYPVAPWEWDGATADFELPSSVIAKEGIEWVDKPLYNAVFVVGATADGIIGHVKRTGSAGDIVAPMVTDALITDAIAARQRGIPVLAETGRVATYSLNLPVLAETGVIEPGSLIRYTDAGSPCTGVVRSTSVTVTMPTVRQTLEVITHG